MDAEAQQRLEEDDQVVASIEDMVDARMDARLKEVHTTLPGIVQSYDPATQRVHVQPAIKRIMRGTGPIALPQCLDCPVQFPAGGAFVMTFPIAKGDECVISFSERCIDQWWQAGGVQEPGEYRMHDYSDGFAMVGVSSKPRALSPAPATDAVEVRTRDGATKIRMTTDTVTVVAQHVKVQCTDAVVEATSVDLGAGSLVPLVNGVVLAKGIDTLTGATYGALGSASATVKAKV